jgi:hypothetical protein
MNLANALDTLFSNGMGHIKVVAWDLDETLGNEGGWVLGSLDKYITEKDSFIEAMKYLRAKKIKTVLISRNSAFCGDMFEDSERQVSALGFHHTAKCPRKRMHVDKVTIAAEVTDVPIRNILLIDDLTRECKAAAAAGGQAIHIPHGPAVETIPDGRFALWVHDKKTGLPVRIEV